MDTTFNAAIKDVISDFETALSAMPQCQEKVRWEAALYWGLKGKDAARNTLAAAAEDIGISVLLTVSASDVIDALDYCGVDLPDADWVDEALSAAAKDVARSFYMSDEDSNRFNDTCVEAFVDEAKDRGIELKRHW